MEDTSINQTSENTCPKCSLVGSIIVILILIAGGAYLWSRSGNTDTTGTATSTEIETAGSQTVGSDEVDTLETELNATTLGDLDSAATDLDTEVGQ